MKAPQVANALLDADFSEDFTCTKLDDTAIPEIQRTNLGRVVVMLNSLDINGFVHFDFMWTDRPPRPSSSRSSRSSR